MDEVLEGSFDTTINASFTPSRFTSTPFKKPGIPKKRNNAGKKKKTFVREVCDTCEICGQEYRCKRSYQKHMRKHSMFEAASRFPDLQQVLQYCFSSIRERILKVKEYPAYGTLGDKYRSLCNALTSEEVGYLAEWSECFDLVHEAVTKSIDKNKILLPSALVAILMENAEQLLSDLEKRQVLCDLVQVCVCADSVIIHCFFSDFVLCLVKNIISFYKSLLSASASQLNSVNDVSFDNEDKEAIHYVSGAVVRAFFRRSQQSAKNASWQNIAKVIRQRLTESDAVAGAPVTVKGWTNAQNRGKLFMVSGTLFDFFVGVAGALEKTTTIKKINVDLVIESVCNSSLIVLWDSAVGDLLGESLSYNLMCNMVRSFCNTYGGGHTKKLVNAYHKKAQASVTLRHKVAPRS